MTLWLVGIVITLFGIAQSLNYQGKALTASEEQKKKLAPEMNKMARIWMWVF